MKLNVSLIVIVSLLSFSAIGTPTQVTEQEIVNRVILNGRVEAITEATVSALVNAEVKQIHVDVDDKVTTGALLMELDDTELKAQLAKAHAGLKVSQAQYQQSQSEYQRLKALASDSFVSANDMTKALSAVAVAKANIELAQAQIAEVKQLLSYTRVIAPYSGIVTARHVELGETANIGQPLLSGFALNQNRLSVQVPNSLISYVENNQSLYAKGKTGTWLQLTNLTIAPSADMSTHTVMVRANISKNEFSQRPGSFIQVAVLTDKQTILSVPTSALFYQGDLAAVYVKVADSFVLRQVLVGAEFEQQTEIISGLQKGDLVITNGAAYLADYSHKTGN